MSSRHLRLVTALALAPMMLVSVAFVGSSAFGKPRPTVAQYQYKVVLCHRTGSVSNPGVTIRVSSRAVPAHLRHGDTLGPCQTQSSSTSSTGRGNGNAQRGRGRGQGGQSQGQGQGQGNTGGQGQGNGKGNR